jgi:hypothetical protein
MVCLYELALKSSLHEIKFPKLIAMMFTVSTKLRGNPDPSGCKLALDFRVTWIQAPFLRFADLVNRLSAKLKRSFNKVSLSHP